jgi:hypothetical protein
VFSTSPIVSITEKRKSRPKKYDVPVDTVDTSYH